MNIDSSKKEQQAIKQSFHYIKNWKYYRILFLSLGICLFILAFIIDKENDFQSFLLPISAGLFGYIFGSWSGPINNKILAKLIDHI